MVQIQNQVQPILLAPAKRPVDIVEPGFIVDAGGIVEFEEHVIHGQPDVIQSPRLHARKVRLLNIIVPVRSALRAVL